MLYNICKYDLLREFQSESLGALETKISSLPPSLCEYHFENIIILSQSDSYMNRNQIEMEFYFGEFKLYKMYDDELYLERDMAVYEDEQCDTLW